MQRYDWNKNRRRKLVDWVAAIEYVAMAALVLLITLAFLAVGRLLSDSFQ